VTTYGIIIMGLCFVIATMVIIWYIHAKRKKNEYADELKDERYVTQSLTDTLRDKHHEISALKNEVRCLKQIDMVCYGEKEYEQLTDDDILDIQLGSISEYNKMNRGK